MKRKPFKVGETVWVALSGRYGIVFAVQPYRRISVGFKDGGSIESPASLLARRFHRRKR